MAYVSTDIPVPTTQVDTPAAPDLNEYQTPDVQTVKPTADSSKFGYQSPSTEFTTNNLNQGLLEYDNSSSKNLTFDGREIDADSINANVNTVTPNFATASNYLTDGAFVENRMTGLLENDNPINQRVQANALASSNARGLANSSIGVTAGQTALIDNAYQIASQDATTQAQGDLARQSATYGAQGKVQDAQNQSALNSQTGAIESALASQTAGQSWDSTEQKAAIQGDLNKQQANIAGAQTTQQAQYDSDARNQAGLLEGAAAEQSANISAELKGLESVSSQNLSILQSKLEAANNTTAEQNAMLIESYQQAQENYRTSINNEYSRVTSQAQLNAAQREALGNQMTEMANNYEISVQNVLLDPNLDADAKNAAIERINSIFDQDMSNIAEVFGATYADTDASGADVNSTSAG